MSSTFDDFTSHFNKIHLTLWHSETRLRVNSDLLEYVKILGYDFVYKNRTKDRGGGIGAYSKRKVQFECYGGL